MKVDKKYLPMIWKDMPDEDNQYESFILTKNALISEYDAKNILVQVKNRDKFVKPLISLANSEDKFLDEGFTSFIVDKASLAKIVSITGILKRRPRENSAFIDEMEDLFAVKLYKCTKPAIGYQED